MAPPDLEAAASSAIAADVGKDAAEEERLRALLRGRFGLAVENRGRPPAR